MTGVQNGESNLATLKRQNYEIFLTISTIFDYLWTYHEHIQSMRFLSTIQRSKKFHELVINRAFLSFVTHLLDT